MGSNRKMNASARCAALLGSLILAGPATAGEADVVDARAEAQPGGQFSFRVTVRHADSGWEHYANAWEVLTPDGELLARRVLYHPHVDEQPFTRSLSGVTIPARISQVRIRAADSVHEFGGIEILVDLPARR